MKAMRREKNGNEEGHQGRREEHEHLELQQRKEIKQQTIFHALFFFPSFLRKQMTSFIDNKSLVTASMTQLGKSINQTLLSSNDRHFRHNVGRNIVGPPHMIDLNILKTS